VARTIFSIPHKQAIFAGAYTLLFILVSSYFLTQEEYLPLLLPLGLAFSLLALLSMDSLLLFIVFLAPLSIKFSELVPQPPFDLDLPTEPLMLLLTFIFIVKYISERTFDARILKHPITITLYIYLLWQLITSITSSMPLVSFKASISKLWFIIPFYFIATQLFKHEGNIRKYFIAYGSSLTIVVTYTLVRHASHYFAQGPAHWVMSPFFRDHTSYGAVLALIIPIFAGVNLLLVKKSTSRILYWMGACILCTGLVFSYTRAAWLGLVGAFALWIIMIFKIKIKYIVVPILIAGSLAYLNKDQIIISMAQNQTESSTSFSEHLSSMTNISSDASNLERLNRWSCAIRMFQERPIFGWGPGTYMFKYAPFQLESERTVISTNASDLGNAHSEYLGPLAESGLLGMLSVCTIFVVTILTAIRVFYRSGPRWTRHMSLYLLMGLSTYYVHAFLNNFLDTDKLTSIFWGATALIATIDTYHSRIADTSEAKAGND